MVSLQESSFNIFLGQTSGFNDDNPDKLIIGNVNVAIGNFTLMNITSGYKNIAIGLSALHKLYTGSYNTIIGEYSGQSITGENKNVMLGAQSGVFVNGENKVFIGTGAGHSNNVSIVESVNNRLVIHSNVNLIPSSNITVLTSFQNSSDISQKLLIAFKENHYDGRLNNHIEHQ